MRTFALLSILLLAPQDDAAVDALIRALDSDSAAERDRAQKALLERGERVAPRLKAAEAQASGEPKARLAAILREIGIRREEAEVAKAGIPAKLARQVPRFRERFLAADDQVVLQCLKDIWGNSPVLGEEDPWMFGSSDLDHQEIGAVVRSVLARARTAPLKTAALRLASRFHIEDLGDDLGRLVDDPDPGVRRLLLKTATNLPVKGGEETFGRLLKEGSEDDKQDALQALEQLKTPKARRAMVVALEDPSAEIRSRGIQALSWSRDEAAIPAIRRLLKDPDGRVRYMAVWALQNARAFDALDDILALERDPDGNVRRGVIGLIGFWADPRGKDAVLRALTTPAEDDGLERAISAAASLRLAEALPILVRLLTGEDAKHADKAARAIADIGPGTQEKELLGMVTGADGMLRRRALVALASAAPSTDALAAQLRAAADPDAKVRQAAVAALAKAKGPQVLEALKTALQDDATRDVVLKALVESPQRGAGRLAIEFLKDDDPKVVVRALEVIERQYVLEAIPAVEGLLVNPSREVSKAAINALDRVGGPRAFPAMLRVLDQVGPETQRRMWNFFAMTPDEKIVEAAIQRFSSLAPDAQTFAMQALADFPSAPSTEFLAKLVDDPQAPLRSLAIRPLVLRGHPAGLRAAREELRTARGQNRITAAALVVQYGEPDDQTVRILVEGIQSADEYMKAYMFGPLVERLRPEAKPLLLDGLLEKEWYQRDAYAKGMARYPAGTFDADLRKLAAAPEETARRGAARALTHVEMADRLDLLRKLLQDPSVPVRSEAVMAFWLVKPKSAPAELVARLSDDSDEVRRWTVDVLSKFDPAVLKDRAEGLLADRSPGVREKAASAAARAKFPVARALLEKLLADPDGSVRSSAAWALGRLGHKESAEALIRRWEDDPNPWTRSNAAHALLEMGHDRGLEAVRSIAHQGPPVVHGYASITLMEKADRPSLPSAIAFVGRSSHTFSESNRTLLAMNAFAQPDLYRKAKETKIDLRSWKGTERDWLAKLADALGLKVEIDPAVPTFAIGSRPHEWSGWDRTVADELASIGYYLNGAAILEPGRVRVIRRFDALDHWERWNRETK